MTLISISIFIYISTTLQPIYMLLHSNLDIFMVIIILNLFDLILKLVLNDTN